jgi:hypothetical protein
MNIAFFWLAMTIPFFLTLWMFPRLPSTFYQEILIGLPVGSVLFYFVLGHYWRRIERKGSDNGR